MLSWSIGAGWTVGWTGSGLDDGARLADAAEVVVATFSYRLGSLGWAFGNWGVLDHPAVLDWVQREIAVFGGDPARRRRWEDDPAVTREAPAGDGDRAEAHDVRPRLCIASRRGGFTRSPSDERPRRT